MKVKSAKDLLSFLYEQRCKGELISNHDLREQAFLKFNIFGDRPFDLFVSQNIKLGYLEMVDTGKECSVKEQSDYRILLNLDDLRFKILSELEWAVEPSKPVTGRSLCESLIVSKGLVIRYIGRSALMVAKDLIVADDIAKERGETLLTVAERNSLVRMFRL